MLCKHICLKSVTKSHMYMHIMLCWWFETLIYMACSFNSWVGGKLESGIAELVRYLCHVHVYGTEWKSRLKIVYFLLCHKMELSWSCSTIIRQHVKIQKHVMISLHNLSPCIWIFRPVVHIMVLWFPFPVGLCLNLQ